MSRGARFLSIALSLAAKRFNQEEEIGVVLFVVAPFSI
jgi:hypothetical protein